MHEEVEVTAAAADIHGASVGYVEVVVVIVVVGVSRIGV